MNRLIAHRLLFAAIFLPLTLSAQPPDTLSTYHWDYNDFHENAECIRAVPSGGYVATGATYYQSSVQVWTARLDQDMNEIWLSIEGEGDTDAGYYIEPTSDGGFIQCGETWSIPGHSADGFIRKLNANGEQEWMRIDGQEGLDSYFMVREVPSGGYIATGDPWHVGIYRFDSNGNPLWWWHDEDVFAWPEWVEPCADGGFLVASDSWNEIINRRVPTIYKVSAAGETLWMNDEVEEGGPTELEGFAQCVREDAEGIIYVCGSVIRIETHPETFTDFYVSKRNPDGSIIWSVFIENTGLYLADRAFDVSILPDGNIAAFGVTQDEDTILDLWLVKFNPDGEIIWSSDLSFSWFAQPTSLDQGRDGSIVGSYYVDSPIGDPYEISFVKWEPEVVVGLQVLTPVIPETGGWLRYGAQVNNILVDPTPLDAWVVLIGPNGNRTPLNQFPVTLQPGVTWTRPQINVHIPAAAPNGTYTLEAHLGDADTRKNMGLGSFQFTKGE